LAKHKMLLVGCRWKAAGRARACRFNKGHQLVKGDRVLEVRNGMGWVGYCQTCGEAMLHVAHNEIANLLSAASHGQPDVEG
jgi:hypothetical protein